MAKVLHGLRAVAPLKRPHDPLTLAFATVLHGLRAVAPLKRPIQERLQVRRSCRSPRSSCRGPIEASALGHFWRHKLESSPRSSGRGPIEAPLFHNHWRTAPCTVLHGLRAVAPLKLISERHGREASCGSPRSSCRGPIEACVQIHDPRYSGGSPRSSCRGPIEAGNHSGQRFPRRTTFSTVFVPWPH